MPYFTRPRARATILGKRKRNSTTLHEEHTSNDADDERTHSLPRGEWSPSKDSAMPRTPPFQLFDPPTATATDFKTPNSPISECSSTTLDVPIQIVGIGDKILERIAAIDELSGHSPRDQTDPATARDILDRIASKEQGSKTIPFSHLDILHTVDDFVARAHSKFELERDTDRHLARLKEYLEGNLKGSKEIDTATALMYVGILQRWRVARMRAG